MLVLSWLVTAHAGSQLVCITNTVEPLEAHPVSIALDTEALVTKGELDANCEGLWAEGALRPATYWVESGTCNTGNTLIWVNLGNLATDEVVGVRMHWSPTPAAILPDGEAVFPFFDDFVDDFGGWTRKSNGATVTYEEGEMRTRGAVLLHSQQPVFAPDTTELVARIDWSLNGPEPELGAGFVNGSNGFGYDQRSWKGFVHRADDDGEQLVTAEPSGPCITTGKYAYAHALARTYGGHAPVRLSVRWGLDGTELWSEIEGFATEHRIQSPGCELDPVPMPVLLLTDDETTGDANDPEQRTDFVFVRPRASSEPIVNYSYSGTCGPTLPDTGGSGTPGTTPPTTDTTSLPPHGPRLGTPAKGDRESIGCGCASGPAPHGWGVLALLLFSARLHRTRTWPAPGCARARCATPHSAGAPLP